MGSKYSTTPAIAFNSAPPPDDGTQVAANLIQWSMVKTKLADPIHTQADSIDSKLVSALDLSARAISSNDTAVATDHWKTLQVTGATTISLSSAASMGAGYEVGVFNAGSGVVTVNPAGSDTINAVTVGVTVSLKGTKIFRTNQGLTGYNVVGGYDPQNLTVSGANTAGSFTTSTASAAALKVISSSSSNGGNLTIENSTGSGGNFRNWAITTNFNTNGAFELIPSAAEGGNALAGTSAFKLTKDGVLSLPTAPFDLSGAAAGQISFPATQNPSAGANVLDDYEEGTWTPSVTGTATYTVQTGTYTKIGRLVFIRGTLVINTIGTGSTITISGLPFSANADHAISVANTASLATNVVSVTAEVVSATTTIALTSRTVASASETTNPIFGNGAQVIFAGCYQV